MSVRHCAVATLVLLSGGQNAVAAQAPEREVRQLVTFHFQPGRSAEALRFYREQLREVYLAVTPLRRFRAFREVESPEPLDLVVVSTYESMAAMDLANEALRRPVNGVTAGQLYGVLSGMTQSHHDQFMERIAALSDVPSDTSGLVVFEYVRVSPGQHRAWEALVGQAVRPQERRRQAYRWSETGRLLVSDGWDYLRLYGIASLGEWQALRTLHREGSLGDRLDRLTAARKIIILRAVPELAVR